MIIILITRTTTTMAEHKRTRTTTMSWQGLSLIDDDDDDDDFYDSNNRISAVVPFDMAGGLSNSSDLSDSSEDDNALEDPKMSFVSEYDLSASISERRQRLFKGMGLNSSKHLGEGEKPGDDREGEKGGDDHARVREGEKGGEDHAHVSEGEKGGDDHARVREGGDDHVQVRDGGDDHAQVRDGEKGGDDPCPSPMARLIIRSRSDGDIEPFKRSKEQLIGHDSKQRLTRTSSTVAPFISVNAVDSNEDNNNNTNISNNKTNSMSNSNSSRRVASESGALCLIKNLDTGNEFIAKDGTCNQLSDLQTGKELSVEEFDKSVGYSPVVKELMRSKEDESTTRVLDNGKKKGISSISKRFRSSKKRGASLLKNINNIVTQHLGSISENKEDKSINESTVETQNKDEWVRVRSQGKNYKELSALRFCQEIQGAHQGSIWSIKFNPDGRFLATAGEDKVVHIWQVQECEIATAISPPEESVNSTSMFIPSHDRGAPPDLLTLDKNRVKSANRIPSDVMPDYVCLPESLFALSDEPICSFEGHLDDVLDLSWSTSQLLLLSSSMDKTVRLWDLEKKNCLKLFAHNDYVTCIQFNPVNDDYFISGSLDAKLRIWNVPERRVVDWTDLHEMVTAACYTPDGQGAIVGSHKGNIRTYDITDGKLNQTSQFVIQTKKKSGPKKITGFQFTADNPTEVLVTSADSRIRIYEGSEMTQKFKGFLNESSQIAASFSTNEKYAICASEDSNVYIWKREESKNGKSKSIIRTNSHEYFPCKDVSVAIPWPGSQKFEPPFVSLHSKKRHSNRLSSISLPFSPTKDDDKNKKHHHFPPLPNNNKKDANHIEKISNNIESNKTDDSQECDSARITRSDSSSSELFNSAGASGSSLRQMDSSPSMSSNSGSWIDGGDNTTQAQAWGLVIVTAGLGGEIKAYQNIGIPIKHGRQTSLLR